MEAYFDNSATTVVLPQVAELVNHIMTVDYGNPSSMHLKGVQAEKYIRQAREDIAKTLHCKDKEIIFTSGGTESNNMAIIGACMAAKRKGKHIITTSFEHSSIYGLINYLVDLGYKVDFVKINADGLVDLDDLENLITDDTILVSIGCVNSEIGVRQDIEGIGKMLKKYKSLYFHSDITQAIGKVKVDLTNVDLASFSGHKIFCFKGIGCLIKKKNVSITPLIHGVVVLQQQS